MRLGVIGLGFIGARHVRAIQACAGVRLRALVDPSAERRAAFAHLGVPTFGSVEDMLANTNLDGAVVATPSELHADAAVKCLAAGLHALVEKPIATTIDDADLIVDASHVYRRQVLVGYNRRYYDVVQTARDLLRNRIGDLIAVAAQWTVRKQDSYYDADWRRARAAGPVMINLTHDVDMLRFFCGDVESVSAVGTNRIRRFEKEDAVAMTLRFRSGVLGTFMLSDASHSPWAWELATGESEEFKATGQNSYRFMGSKGSVEFPNLVLWKSSAREPNWMEGIRPEHIPVRHGDAFLRQIAHFRDVASGAAEPMIPAADGRETLRTTLAVLRSASLGTTVEL